MKWTKSADELYWWRECGRYFVCRSLSFDLNPGGHWVYLAWFKPARDAAAQLLSPERRDSLEDAVKDCAPHLKGKASPTPQQEQNASAVAA